MNAEVQQKDRCTVAATSEAVRLTPVPFLEKLRTRVADIPAEAGAQLQMLADAWRSHEPAARTEDGVALVNQLHMLGAQFGRGVLSDAQRIGLVGSVVGFLHTRLSEVPTQALGRIAAAFDRAGWREPDFLKSLGSETLSRDDSLKSLVQAAYCLSSRRISHPNFFQAIGEKIRENPDRFESKWLGTMARVAVSCHPTEWGVALTCVQLLSERRAGLSRSTTEAAESVLRSIPLSDHRLLRSIAPNAGARARLDGLFKAFDLEPRTHAFSIPDSGEVLHQKSHRELAKLAQRVYEVPFLDQRWLAAFDHAVSNRFEEAPGFTQSELRSIARVIALRSERVSDFPSKALTSLSRENTTLSLAHSTEWLEIAARSRSARAADLTFLRDRMYGSAEFLCKERLDEVPRILRACVRLKIADADLMHTFENHLLPHLHRCTGHEMVVLAWSTGMAVRGSPAFAQELLKRVEPLLSDLDLDDLVTLSFSAAMIGSAAGTALIQKSVAEIERRLPHTGAHLTDEALSQLRIAGNASMSRLPASIAEQMQVLEAHEAARPQGMNRFECSVAETLQRLGVAYQAQVRRGGYVIDFLVTRPDGGEVILECDGFGFHYFEDGTLSGNGALRDRIFEAQGLKTVRIVFEDWEMRTDRSEFLREVLGVSDSPARAVA